MSGEPREVRVSEIWFGLRSTPSGVLKELLGLENKFCSAEQGVGYINWLTQSTPPWDVDIGSQWQAHFSVPDLPRPLI